MSCDFAVWNQPNTISNKEAVEKYIKLIEEDTSVVEESESIEKFYQALTALHPEIDDLPDDEVDNSYWSCAFDRSKGHLIMCAVWSRAEEAATSIFDLAHKHHLAVFDPQSETINYHDGTSGD